MREEWAATHGTAHIISRRCGDTQHTPVWKLSCRQVSSSRSGLVSQAPGFFFFIPFSFLSVFSFFFFFSSFSFVLKALVYIYIRYSSFSIFFERRKKKKKKVKRRKKGTFFSSPSQQLINSSRCLLILPAARAHTTHAQVCFQLMPWPSRFHLFYHHHQPPQHHLSNFSFFFLFLFPILFVFSGENSMDFVSLSLSINRLHIKREKGKQVYNDRNQWRRRRGTTGSAAFFYD